MKSRPSDSVLAEYLEQRSANADPAIVALAASLEALRRADPVLANAIKQELTDQRGTLKLIASENYASPNVLVAMGNWLTDKYAEGSVGKRWYAGCEHVDTVEQRAAECATSLFDADHAYVQPHSGIDANLVAFWAILRERIELPALAARGLTNLNALGDTEWEELRRELGNQKLMGMAFDAGGHLTHGYRPNISGKLFAHCSYSVDRETETVDYEVLREQAQRERPLIILAGYSSYPRRLNFRLFREIADEVGATLMVDMAHFAGLVAGKAFVGDDNPVPFADVVTTTTHKTLRGPRGGLVLCKSAFADSVDRGCPLVLGGPLPHVMAAKAVALVEAADKSFPKYAAAVIANARCFANELGHSEKGRVVSGGTDNHLCLLDVRGYGLTGMQAERALRQCGITANRNVIPFDPNGAWQTSGVRFGTAALTTRGFGETEMAVIARLVDEALTETEGSGNEGIVSSKVSGAIRESVAEMLSAHPLYPDLPEV